MSRIAVIVLVLSGLYGMGCTTRSSFEVPDTGLSGTDAGPAVDAAMDDTGPRPDTGPRLDDVLIYAHSANTLYTFSPYTNTVSTVGVFNLADGSMPPNMLDLAVNSAGDIYTTSNRLLFRVNPETARLTEVGEYGLGDARLYALTFLVAGQLGATEALIGATNEGVYYEVSVSDASARRLGTYPDGWESSGDIVSVEGLGNFATLRRSDYPDTDVLAEITFRRDGTSTVRVIGEVGFRQVFGLGYWGRNLYGFTNEGQLVQIDRGLATGTLSTAATGTDQFWGAGVTTQAPVLF